MFMSPYYECCIAQKRDDDMNDPMLTETLIITSSFLGIIAVLVASVLILERMG